MKKLVAAHNASRSQRRSMSLAGCYFFFQKLPVKDNRPLPRFKLGIKRLAKEARPHLPGLDFFRHGSTCTSHYWFMLDWIIPLVHTSNLTVQEYSSCSVFDN